MMKSVSGTKRSSHSCIYCYVASSNLCQCESMLRCFNKHIGYVKLIIFSHVHSVQYLNVMEPDRNY